MRSTGRNFSGKFADLRARFSPVRFGWPGAGVALCLCFGALAQAPAQAQGLTITSTLPAAALGVQYSQQLTATGGTPPYAWSVSGALPPGLSLTASGLLSGIPSKAGTYSFALNVQDSRQAIATSGTSLVVYTGFAITTTTLPAGKVGQSYGPVTLSTAGGVAPFKWQFGPGVPPGLSLSSDGVLSGTPTSSGSFQFSVQASDSAGNSATATLSLSVTSAPLTITTIAPLFAGTVGQAYAQTFNASGGKPPYTWAIVGSLPAGLTLNSSTGAVSGTPTAPGTTNFTVQVTDSASATATQNFSIVVNPPSLTLTVLSGLPGGMVGAAYSQKLPLTVSGGTPPYTWSLPSGSPPGLTFDPAAVALNGIPSAAGVFNFSVQVSDAAGASTSTNLSVTITAAQLSIATPVKLPDGALNVPYTQTLAANGGAPPYNWSATGLPAGLTLNPSTGVMSGTPTAAGSFAIAITVQDSVLARASDRFTLNISYPPAPNVTLSGLPATASPAQQYSLTVTTDNPYPVDISGQLILSFSPDIGPADQTIQFASGGATANFTIPAGTTSAVASVPLALQTGTASGTLEVSVRLQAGGVDITPSPAPSLSTRIAAAAPVITSLKSTISNNTLNIIITGYATSRDMIQAIFNFAAAQGQTLQSTASSLTVDVSSLFNNWFRSTASSEFGTQFIFTQPFTIQGNPQDVVPVSVTMVNRIGSTTAKF